MAASSMQMIPVMSTGSLAASAKVDSDTESPSSTPFVIKNTFIDLSEDSSNCSSRRCASAPATPRGGQTATNAEKGEYLGMKPCESLPFNLSSLAKERDAEISSTCTDDSLDWAALEASETGSVASNHEGMTIYLDELLPAKSVRQRAKLSSQAKAWVPPCQPAGGGAGRTALPQEVHKRFARIVQAGQAELHAWSIMQAGTEVRNTASSWSLTGSLAPELFQHAGHALQRVQNAILQAAEQSADVYVIGYEARPFSSISGKIGVRAQLGLVQDESSACWDLLAKGFCNRGCACRWQHPSWQVSVDVVMEPSYV